MKKIISIFITVVFCSVIFLDAQAAVDKRYNKNKESSVKTKKSKVVRSEAGLNIKDWGIAVDAAFDPRLDDIVPGYHIINIVLTNKRGEPIQLSTKRDKWYIVDSLGKKHLAYNHVKQFDKKLWPQFPKKMQDMLEYPHMVSPGKASNIDIFLPKSVDLFHFREVIWKSAHFKKEFNLFTNYEKSLSLPKKEIELQKKKPIDESALENESQDSKFSQNPDTEAVAKTSDTSQPPQELEVNETNKTTSTKEASVEGFIRVK